MTQTALNIALSYLNRGWKPVPIPFRQKKPIFNDWQKVEITRENAPNYFNGDAQNIGVQLGRASGGLTDVDLDCKEAIALAPMLLPETGAVFGHQSKPCSHQLYVTDLCDSEQKATLEFQEPTEFGKGVTLLELRVGAGAKGAQTIFPGSTHKETGERVIWVNDETPPRVAGSALKAAVTRLAVAVLLVRHYPGKGGRHAAALVLGGVLARAGWNEEEIDEFVTKVAKSADDDEWADRANSAKSAVDLLAKGDKAPGLPKFAEKWGEPVAKRLAQWLNLRGGGDGPPGKGGGESKHEDVLAELNRDNALVLDGGKVWVLRFEQIVHNLNGQLYEYRVPIYLSTADFRTLYLNRRVNTGESVMDTGKWWLFHPKRRQYLGLVFEPGGESIINGKLNLWTGWGVKPKRGDWSLMREHIFEVVAARDEEVDAYINWLAWSVQHPEQQAEVAPVFLGKRGTGRGTLGNAMCRIFGNHGLHITSSHHLVGRFNNHLRQVAYLFADEAYPVADRGAEGRLKGLLTEPTIAIEGKGRDVIIAPNHLKVMMASNDDWVVPAGEKERRFVVQEVADDHAQDPAWFKPLYEQLQNGGLEAMLFDLLNRELGDWHPRQIVRTATLAAQQAKSLSPFDAWFEDLLQDGYLPAGDESGQVISGEYRVRKSDGHHIDKSKKTWFERRHGLYELARTSSPGLKKETDAAFGRYLGKRGCKREWVDRQRGWQFPTLEQARKEWKERFPDTVWDSDAKLWHGERDQDDAVVVG